MIRSLIFALISFVISNNLRAFQDNSIHILPQDTIWNKQQLYSGKVWINDYKRFENDQFIFANYFLPGTISMNGKLYNNVAVKYDILKDEILIPFNSEEILQVNKEYIDSFLIDFEGSKYRFLNIRNNPANLAQKLNGFYSILYEGKSILYLKYSKSILTDITVKSDGRFFQTESLYLVRNGVTYSLVSLKDLSAIYSMDVSAIKDLLKKSDIKIVKGKPESFAPAVRFLDNLIE